MLIVIYTATFIFISAMALVPPDLLLNLMGVYSSLTGLLGFMANGAAIFLFARTSKVRLTFSESIKCFDET